MNLLGRLTLLFVVVPLLELVLLVRLGQLVGLWPTLGLVVATGALGAAMARAEGLRAVVRFQTRSRFREPKKSSRSREEQARTISSSSVLRGDAAP